MIEQEPGISPLVIKATMLRVEGHPIRAIAARMGYSDVSRFRADWREGYQTELGALTPITAAIELVNLRLLNLRRLSQGHHLQAFDKLPPYDREFLQDLLKPAPSFPKSDWDTIMDFDYIPGQTPEVTTLLKANNPVQEAILYLAYLSQHPDTKRRLRILSPTSQSELQTITPDYAQTLNEGLIRVDSEKIEAISLTGSNGTLERRTRRLPHAKRWSPQNQPETTVSIMGTSLDQTQIVILKLSAEGLTGKQISSNLGMSSATRIKKTRSIGIAMGLPIPKSRQQEVISANKIAAVNMLMTTGHIDPLKIAAATLDKPESLIESFGKLTPYLTQILELVAEGRTVSSIAAEATNKSAASSDIDVGRKSIIVRISAICRAVNATSRTHLVVLFAASKRLKTMGIIPQ